MSDQAKKHMDGQDHVCAKELQQDFYDRTWSYLKDHGAELEDQSVAVSTDSVADCIHGLGRIIGYWIAGICDMGISEDDALKLAARAATEGRLLYQQSGDIRKLESSEFN